MSRLAGKLALIAAARGDFVTGIAAHLKREGATVALATTGELSDPPPGWPGCDCHRVVLDDEASWATVFRTLREQHGRIDALVTSSAETPAKPLSETTLDEFQAATRTTIDMVFAANRAAILAMRESLPDGEVASGAIVNLTSFASHVGLRRGAMLCAIAGGIWNLSRQLGVETGENGEQIRVNSVHTGPSEAQAQALGIDARFVVDAGEQVAEAVAYLLSDEARLITAADITIDRGLSSGL